MLCLPIGDLKVEVGACQQSGGRQLQAREAFDAGEVLLSVPFPAVFMDQVQSYSILISASWPRVSCLEVYGFQEHSECCPMCCACPLCVFQLCLPAVRPILFLAALRTVCLGRRIVLKWELHCRRKKPLQSSPGAHGWPSSSLRSVTAATSARHPPPHCEQMLGGQLQSPLLCANKLPRRASTRLRAFLRGCKQPAVLHQDKLHMQAFEHPMNVPES